MPTMKGVKEVGSGWFSFPCVIFNIALINKIIVHLLKQKIRVIKQGIGAKNMSVYNGCFEWWRFLSKHDPLLITLMQQKLKILLSNNQKKDGEINILTVKNSLFFLKGIGEKEAK